MSVQDAKKILTEEQADDINARLSGRWEEMKEIVTSITIETATLERAWVLAGVPTRARDIRLDVERMMTAQQHAHLTRNRFTFLDIEAMRAPL